MYGHRLKTVPKVERDLAGAVFGAKAEVLQVIGQSAAEQSDVHNRK
jgi:hypothetical protein